MNVAHELYQTKWPSLTKAIWTYSCLFHQFLHYFWPWWVMCSTLKFMKLCTRQQALRSPLNCTWQWNLRSVLTVSQKRGRYPLQYGAARSCSLWWRVPTFITRRSLNSSYEMLMNVLRSYSSSIISQRRRWESGNGWWSTSTLSSFWHTAFWWFQAPWAFN